MAKKKPTKLDTWLVDLTSLSVRFGIAMAEHWDGSKLKDARTGKELARGMIYVCGLYSANKPLPTKSKERSHSRPAKDVQGFANELGVLCQTHGVRLELRSSPMFLVDVETLEPLARLAAMRDGYSVAELQPS